MNTIISSLLVVCCIVGLNGVEGNCDINACWAVLEKVNPKDPSCEDYEKVSTCLKDHGCSDSDIKSFVPKSLIDMCENSSPTEQKSQCGIMTVLSCIEPSTNAMKKLTGPPSGAEFLETICPLSITFSECMSVCTEEDLIKLDVKEMISDMEELFDQFCKKECGTMYVLKCIEPSTNAMQKLTGPPSRAEILETLCPLSITFSECMSVCTEEDLIKLEMKEMISGMEESFDIFCKTEDDDEGSTSMEEGNCNFEACMDVLMTVNPEYPTCEDTEKVAKCFENEGCSDSDVTKFGVPIDFMRDFMRSNC